MVENVLSRHGFAPVLCSQTLGGVHEDDYVRMLLEHSVSGIIFVSGIHAIADGHARPLPAARRHGPADRAGERRRPGPRRARALHRRRRRRGARADPPRAPRPPPDRDRARAAALHPRAAPRRGLPRAASPGAGWCRTTCRSSELVECTAYTVEGGVVAAQRLLDRGVTGILCGSDVMALGVVRAVRQAGLRVPEDVSVVGSDDSLLVEFTAPAADHGASARRGPRRGRLPRAGRPDRRPARPPRRGALPARAGGARLDGADPALLTDAGRQDGPVPTYAAFLRAINLGATRKFPKDAIKAAVEGAGMTDVETYINTGNVRFTTPHALPGEDRGGAGEGVPGRPRLRGADLRLHPGRAGRDRRDR